MLHEEVVLGTILKFPYLLDSNLKVEYFQQQEHQSIFKAMKQLKSAGKHIDLITLITKFPPEQFGGIGKLNKMQTMANEERFDIYKELLIEQWREIEKLNILEIARLENWGLERITNELNNLISSDFDDHVIVRDLLVQMAEAPWTPPKKTRGMYAGLDSLQRMTNGWQNGDLIYLAARPSIGKTDLMLHIARQVGWKGYLPLVFSLEMKGEKLVDRLIAAVGTYNRYKMKNPYELLTDKQKQTWTLTLEKTRETNIEIFESPEQTVSEIRMKARKVKNTNPDKQLLIMIDYLTYIKPTDTYKGNMHLSVSEISKSLKAMAKEFNCPVLCLAQLNRGVEQRQDKRPMLSDLRESGSIEEDADVVMFLYRDSYYYKEKETDPTLEIHVAKNRDGETGTIYANYNRFTGIIRD